MIPKVFHRIWVPGSPEMPEEFVRYGRTWLDLNPGWDYREWRSWPEWGVNRGLFESAPNAAQASDVLRYEILAHEGGAYLDTDFEALKPLEDLIVDIDCFAASEFPFNNDAQPHVVSAGIIGAVPGHPVMLDAVASLAESISVNYNRGQSWQSGPWFLTSVVARHPRACKVFSREQFYPYLYDAADPGHDAYPNAIAVHHWAASWCR